MLDGGAGPLPCLLGVQGAPLNGRLREPSAFPGEGLSLCKEGWLYTPSSARVPASSPAKTVFFLSSCPLTLDHPVGLRGTKLGCGEGGCGACTVMFSKYDRLQDKIVYPLPAGWSPLWELYAEQVHVFVCVCVPLCVCACAHTHVALIVVRDIMA